MSGCLRSEGSRVEVSKRSILSVRKPLVAIILQF